MPVRKILKKYARPASLHAAEPVKTRLLADLRAARKLNSRLYSVLFGVLCVLTLIAMAALAADAITGRNIRYTVVAGAGVSLPALVAWMRKVIREWSESELLITLVAHSNEATIQTVLQKLLSGGAIASSASSASGGEGS
jgi:hypothetical protein